MTFRTATVATYLKLIADLCRTHRLPAVFDAREYVEVGGLMSYGPNIDTIYRQLATYVGEASASCAGRRAAGSKSRSRSS